MISQDEGVEKVADQVQDEAKDEEEEDAQEAMNLVGKDEDDLRARRITKDKLKVTKVPNLVLGYKDDVKIYFRHCYEYVKFLGTGSFGFVVSAKEKDTGRVVALKVSSNKDICLYFI